MTIKALTNTLAILTAIQFFIGFTGTLTTDLWDIAVGFILIAIIIVLTYKVNKK